MYDGDSDCSLTLDTCDIPITEKKGGQFRLFTLSTIFITHSISFCFDLQMKRLYIHKLIKLVKYLVLTGLIGYYFFDREPIFLEDVDEKEEDGGKLVERELVERELVNTKVKNREAVINHPSMIYSEFKETINILSETQEPDVLGQVPANIHDQHKIIIVTEWRSGSSFLGDIFNMHPDVFYNVRSKGLNFKPRIL